VQHESVATVGTISLCGACAQLFVSVEQALGKVGVDVEWLLGQVRRRNASMHDCGAKPLWCAFGEQLVQNPAKVDPKSAGARLTQILQLKTCLMPMLALRDLLQPARTPLLAAIRTVRFINYAIPRHAYIGSIMQRDGCTHRRLTAVPSRRWSRPSTR
jgi:hypothetical protein